MKYDDASWHFEGDFPEGSPEEFGGTHIGLFLRYCFTRGWAGELHLTEWPEQVGEVTSGKMTGTDFLMQFCDGKLTDEDLTEEGNGFAQWYYEEYLNDYVELYADLMYVAPEADHDFGLLRERLDGRYEEFLASGESG